MMDGILLIDKPLGKTSHDMVYFVRRLTGIKKVGHTGTLDPDASGVLPICIGKATKACDMLTSTDKRYVAELVLGKTTDTQDASGKVISESEVNVTAEDIQKAINEFIGEIEQIPPMFSAIKKNGQKLYELARKGITVEREPRKVTIFSIEVLNIDLGNNSIQIDVHCSKGTYIRTLCEDIGNKLGCGAYMNTLRRTYSGGFGIDKCMTTDELLNIKETGKMSEVIIPTDMVFERYEKLILDDKFAAMHKNGIRIRKFQLEQGKLYRVYDNDGSFLSVSSYDGNELIAEKTFWS